MSPLFGKKPSALDKRIQRIREEADRVDHDLRLLSKFIEKPKRSVDFSRLKSATLEPPREPPAVATRRGAPAPGRAPLAPLPSAGPAPAAVSPTAAVEQRPESRGGYHSGKAKTSDERFADYLASSFQAARPLRQERRIQRNKAIIMLVVVILLSFWILYRVFWL